MAGGLKIAGVESWWTDEGGVGLKRLKGEGEKKRKRELIKPTVEWTSSSREGVGCGDGSGRDGGDGDCYQRWADCQSGNIQLRTCEPKCGKVTREEKKIAQIPTKLKSNPDAQQKNPRDCPGVLKVPPKNKMDVEEGECEGRERE